DGSGQVSDGFRPRQICRVRTARGRARGMNTGRAEGGVMKKKPIDTEGDPLLAEGESVGPWNDDEASRGSNDAAAETAEESADEDEDDEEEDDDEDEDEESASPDVMEIWETSAL